MRQPGAVGIAAPGEVDPIGAQAACDPAICSREDARTGHAFYTKDELQLPPVAFVGISAPGFRYIAKAIAEGRGAGCCMEASQQSHRLGEDLVGVDTRRRVRRPCGIRIELAQLVDAVA